LQFDGNFAVQLDFERTGIAAEPADDDQILLAVDRSPGNTGEPIQSPEAAFRWGTGCVIISGDADQCGFIGAVSSIDVDLGVEDGLGGTRVDGDVESVTGNRVPDGGRTGVR
jgi:hypothetical protein